MKRKKLVSCLLLMNCIFINGCQKINTSSSSENSSFSSSNNSSSSQSSSSSINNIEYDINISLEEYYDKTYGGLIAELWGNFSGLPTEFQYTTTPNPEDVPWLVSSTYSTDDDTSLEYVWTHAMETYGVNDITYQDLVIEWKNHIRDYIWCGNASAKSLMDKGYLPPLTGSRQYNPDYRAIDAQIECEVFGMISPGMKENAKSRSAWWLASVGDGVALELASFYSALIAELYVNDDILSSIRNVQELYDINSSAYKISDMIFRIKDKYPNYTWLQARQILTQTYYKNNNTLDCEINFAMTLMSLMYGNGDFKTTGQIALRAGFDNDCNAATACLMMGVFLGYKNLPDDLKEKSGDRYINTNRPGLGDDTISNWANRITNLGKEVVNLAQGKIDDTTLKTNDIEFIPNQYVVDDEIRISIADETITNYGFSKIYNNDFYNSFGLATATKDATLEFSFYGNFVTVYALTCLQAGSFEIFVDNTSYGTICLEQSTTLTLNKEINQLPQSLVKRIYNLTASDHTLKIVALGDETIELDSIGYGTTSLVESEDSYEYL